MAPKKPFDPYTAIIGALSGDLVRSSDEQIVTLTGGTIDINLVKARQLRMAALEINKRISRTGERTGSVNIIVDEGNRINIGLVFTRPEEAHNYREYLTEMRGIVTEITVHTR